MNTDLKDKVIIITGAGGGLGRATALALAQKGAKLALVGKTEDKHITTANLCGRKARVYTCNIRDRQEINQTFFKIIADFRIVDILINNAGVYYEGWLHQEPEAEIDNMIETNIAGLINFTRAVLPHMVSNKSGQILNVSSVAGTDDDPEYAVYTASKHAVTGFTKSLKKEVESKNIRVMAINPGPINTNILKAAGYKYGFSGKPLDPAHVADVIVFMLTQPSQVNIEMVRVRPFNY